jgi:hypothetical protein
MRSTLRDNSSIAVTQNIPSQRQGTRLPLLRWLSIHRTCECGTAASIPVESDRSRHIFQPRQIDLQTDRGTLLRAITHPPQHRRIARLIPALRGNKSQILFRSRVRQFFDRIYFLLKEKRGGRIRIREFDHAFAAIAGGSHADAEAALRGNQQAFPLSIVSIDCDGNISTFSPESWVRSGCDPLAVLENGGHLLRTVDEIKAGLGACHEQCQYFLFCGGSPANKVFENGTFASAETMFCRHTIKTPFDSMIPLCFPECSCARQCWGDGYASSWLVRMRALTEVLLLPARVLH